VNQRLAVSEAYRIGSPPVARYLKDDRLRLQCLGLKKDWQERILVLSSCPCLGAIAFSVCHLIRSGTKQCLWYNALALLNARFASA